MNKLFLNFHAPRPCCWCSAFLLGVTVSTNAIAGEFVLRSLCSGCYCTLRERAAGIFKLPSIGSMRIQFHYTKQRTLFIELPRKTAKGIIRRIDEHPAYCRGGKANEVRPERNADADECLGDLRQSVGLSVRSEGRVSHFV
jgi:hypothetical protein